MVSQFYNWEGPFIKLKKKKNQRIDNRNILQTLQNMWTAIKIILCGAPVLGHFNLPYPDCVIQASHPSLFPPLSHPPCWRHYLCFFHTGKKLCSVLLFSSSWSTFSTIPLFIYTAIHLEWVPCFDRNKTEHVEFLSVLFQGLFPLSVCPKCTLFQATFIPSLCLSDSLSVSMLHFSNHPSIYPSRTHASLSMPCHWGGTLKRTPLVPLICIFYLKKVHGTYL